MDIIYVGTPEYVVFPLDAILATGHHVSLVVTPPDRASGRGQSTDAPPLKKASLERGLDVYQPENINDERSVERLERDGADLMIVASFGKILSAEVREATAFPAINIHPSLLPKYRGPAPVARTILNGADRTGVTFFRMTDAVDEGPILHQVQTEIRNDENREGLRNRLFHLAADEIETVLTGHETGGLNPVEQEEEEATYAPFLSREEGIVDWTNSAEQIRNHMRAMQPWPSSYTWFEGADYDDPLRIKLYRGEPVASESSVFPGTVMDVSTDGITVQTGRGAFRITELQPSGKQRMDAADFVNGYQPETGDRFRCEPPEQD